MTEKIRKAIKHYENVRDDAVAVLDSGFGSKEGESNSLFKRRKENAVLAIMALKKQLPEKPLEEKRFYGKGKCPNPDCGAVFLDKNTNFCGNCGQALDWSEDNYDEGTG